MCEITEDLFFTDPYEDHPRNSYPPELETDVVALRHDDRLRNEVAALKHRFFSHAEAHLHGDIHSGSVFVAENSLKAIDAEFGYFGPVGFDVGTALGNLLLNYCALPGLVATREAADGREQRLQDVRELWLTFAERFQALAAEKSRDRTLAWPEYVGTYLKKVFADSIGYAGSELIRRTVGMSHVADMKTIRDEAMRVECIRHAISLGKTLIVAASHIDNVDTLIARIRQNG